jgi:hypothetical protein
MPTLAFRVFDADGHQTGTREYVLNDGDPYLELIRAVMDCINVRQRTADAVPELVTP